MSDIDTVTILFGFFFFFKKNSPMITYLGKYLVALLLFSPGIWFYSTNPVT